MQLGPQSFESETVKQIKQKVREARILEVFGHKMLSSLFPVFVCTFLITFQNISSVEITLLNLSGQLPREEKKN